MQVSISQNGRGLPSIEFQGRTFFIAPESGDFKVDIINNGHNRQECVVNVDGVNVINGEQGNVGGPGYVLNSRQKTSIPGWSNGDNSTVQKFCFTTGKSYVERVGGDTSNVGSIGIAIYNEYREQRRNVPLSFSGGLESMGASAGAEGGLEGLLGGPQVGTGYGETEEFKTQSVNFHRSSPSPSTIIIIEYATRTQLRAWGIPVVPARPEPFAPLRGMSMGVQAPPA